MRALREANANTGTEMLTALEYAQIANKVATTLYIVVDATNTSTVTIQGVYVGSIEQDVLIGNDNAIVYLKSDFTGHTNAAVEVYNLV